MTFVTVTVAIFWLLVRSNSSVITQPKKVAVLGASGYTGAELVEIYDLDILDSTIFTLNHSQMRLLSSHDGVEISVLTADRSAGQSFKSIYPQFSHVKVTYNVFYKLYSKFEQRTLGRTFHC